MSTKKNNIKIYDYLDYRFYLSDFYKVQKAKEKKFTFRSFGDQAGVSPSLFKDILNGRQNLSAKVAKKYANAMNLNKKETVYFDTLVHFNNAKNNEDKNRQFEILSQLRKQSKVKFLTDDQYEYFSNWYHSVVRELVVYKKLKGDPELIAKALNPEISVSQVKKSIELLQRLKMISKNGEGEWVLMDAMVSSEYEIQNLSLKNYHQGMIQLAKESIERFKSGDREIQSMTLSTSSKTFQEIKKRIREFTDEIMQLVENDNLETEEIFQLNYQMFPFLKKGDKK